MIMTKDSHGNYVKIEDIKQQDSFKGISPIDFKSNGDNLKNYRIYGNTVNGESVGDRTENLFYKKIENANIASNDGRIYSTESFDLWIGKVKAGETYTSYNTNAIVGFFTDEPDYGVYTYDNSRIMSATSVFTFTVPNGCSYVGVRVLKNDPTAMLNVGSTALPYEPYGYRAPVTITNGTDTQTINIYLPEPIKMVGDDAEYIDYGEQKQHRVRKNLLQNTATSRTTNGVTFTVNNDGSVTCNGTPNSGIYSDLLLSGTPYGENIIIEYDNYIFSCIGTSSALVTIIGNEIREIGRVRGNNVTFTDNVSWVLLRCYGVEEPQTVYPMIRKADISDDTYEPYIENTELDVTLPALPTLSGTNTLSVNTNIKPSKIWGRLNDPRDILYVKDKLGNILFSKYYEIEDEPPLTYKAKKAGTLKDYRIYGNTAGGESVGDRTGNLFDCDNTEDTEVNGIVWNCKNQIITANGATGNLSSSTFGHKRITGLHGSFILACVSDTINACICVVSVQKTPSSIRTYYISTTNSYATFSLTGEEYEAIAYAQVNKNEEVNNAQFFISLTEGSTPPDTYEPYGYRVPVTVNSNTTSIYLPYQIRKVGDEAEYIDYGEQMEHRLRKNLLQNTATSQTINGVTFTVNENKSITCNGTATSNALFLINDFFIASENMIMTGGMAGSSYSSYMLSAINSDNETFYDSGNGLSLTSGAHRIRIRIASGYTCDNLTFYPMIRKASVTDDTYEPYIQDTELDVTLPTLPTLSGTNTLSVETEVQPSDIYLKGKIEKKPKIYYKIYYYSQDGQTLLYTESVLEGSNGMYSGTPTKMADPQYTYTFTGWSTSTNSTTATAGATENIQQNTNLYAAFSKSLKGDTISDSWEEIIANCDNGTYASKYQVGDLKTIDVGSEGPVQMQIVAIDTDLLASNNTKKAPITWISKQLLNTYKAMHSTTSGYLSNWANCDMRTYLRNTILPMLPSVVQNGIKEVTKYTCKRTSSTAWTTVSATENIWLPSYREVSNNTSNCETSGVQYNSIFTDNASRVKSNVGNGAYYWWTRSASGGSYSGYSYYFALMYGSGSANYSGDSCTLSGGVAIGFCT